MYNRNRGYPPNHHRSQDRYHQQDHYPREGNRHPQDGYEDDFFDDHDEYDYRGRHRDTYQTGRDYAQAAYEGHENYGHGFNAAHYEDERPFHYRAERPWEHDRDYNQQEREEYYRQGPPHDYDRPREYGMHNSERYRSMPESRKRRHHNEDPYSDNWSNAYTPTSPW